MKRLPLACLVLLFLLSGCASLKAKREVFENTFYSSYPEIMIKVSSEFEYVGETSEAEMRQAQDSSYTGNVQKNWYIFIQSDEQRIKKAVSIKIQKAPTYFVSDIFGRVKNYHDRGTLKLGGASWQYCSVSKDVSMSGIVTRFITEQDYVVPNCSLVKMFGKVLGAQNNYLVTITYLDFPPTSDYACHFWKPNSDLAHSQREYIEQFKKNSETSFKILKISH
jgi:hypothetical protein